MKKFEAAAPMKVEEIPTEQVPQAVGTMESMPKPNEKMAMKPKKKKIKSIADLKMAASEFGKKAK